MQLDYKLALEHYNKALENGFDESWVRHNRGRLYYDLGDSDIAISDLRRAVELDPNNTAAKSALEFG